MLIEFGVWFYFLSDKRAALFNSLAGTHDLHFTRIRLWLARTMKTPEPRPSEKRTCSTASYHALGLLSLLQSGVMNSLRP